MTTPVLAPPSAVTTKGASKRRSPRDRRSTLLTVLLWILAAYFLVPLVWLLIASTKNNADLFSSFGLWFGARFSLIDNLRDVFSASGGVYARWLLNTVVYAVVSSLGASLLSTMAGYALAKYEFPGRSAVFSIILGSIMIPLTALAIPTYLMFSSFGLTNNMLAVIIPSLVSPFGVYLMRVYAAESIPDSLLEAARVDGAGEIRIFWQVGLRLLGPGLVTVLLFTMVATWNNYFLPLIMLRDPDWYPLTLGLNAWNAQAATVGGEAIFNLVITGSLLTILPLVAAFLLLQRYWQSGLTAGSVK